MLKKIKGVIVSTCGFGCASAYAAVPTEVTTALSTMQADAVTIATVFLVAIIALIAFKFMRKGAT